MTTLLDGNKLAQLNRHQLKKQIDTFYSQSTIRPRLAAIIIGDDTASKIYVSHKAKACKSVGIESTLIEMPSKTSETELVKLIYTLNNDPNIHGILVQLPLPAHISPQVVIDNIAVEKDVDGFHPYNVGRLALRNPTLRSCTPYGIIQLLKHYDISFKGKNATVIGVSNIVGRPMCLELLLAGATVTSCHRYTKSIEKHIEQADIIISATGVRNVFDQTKISKEAVVVDVGIHRINGKLCGDLDHEQLFNHVAYLTPVPGGVGPMTITGLLQNTFESCKRQLGEFE